VGIIMKKIAVVGTLDTKFEEMSFIRNFIKEKGHEPIIIDAGIMGTIPFTPEISRDQVAMAAGMWILKDIQALGDEGQAIAVMAEGDSRIIHDLYKKDRMDAIIGVGGTMGTSLGLAMRELPIGLPKLMVSTIAISPMVSGDAVAKDQVNINPRLSCEQICFYVT
jgi:uncharacterized protein (UPF0261 family)